ncbi:MAG: RICIN domain-containing protein [Calothrix sp. MO_167.B12]|nr:RICIN domain-containing protein [Calothrix sp. MO_167.B12]
MHLHGQKFAHVNSIAHEGKILVFGTTADGKIYYTVKRSGFEDTALQDNEDPLSFEPWKILPLDRSVLDQSVLDREQVEFTDKEDNQLLRSRYGEVAETIESAVAPVQLVSGIGHLYVFRQSIGNKLLVNRFVLDGIKNELVPKLEVRFQRSRQKFLPAESMKIDKAEGKLNNIDSLNFRDINNQPFYEPAIELSLIENLQDGWFSVVLMPTIEKDIYRWNIFAYDSSLQKVILYSLRSSEQGLFSLKDYVFAEPDPDDPEVKKYRNIPGIIKRTLELKDDNSHSLTVVQGLSATAYDTQVERQTQDGMQLMRETRRVMLAVPVQKGTDVITAALSFAVAIDGTLSQIDTSPSSERLKSTTRDILLPLNTLDEVKVIGDSTPPAVGTIEAIAGNTEEKLLLQSVETPLDNTFEPGAKVKVQGTRNFDGHYQVVSADGDTFEVEATFTRDKLGSWEEIQEEENGLVFDNMIVGYEKIEDGKLRVYCTNHDLVTGDEVQISGTKSYDGLYPVKAIDTLKGYFILDADWSTGEAINLQSVKRRGIRFDGSGDYLVTPPIKLKTPKANVNKGISISAWVRQDTHANREQVIVAEEGNRLQLVLDTDNKVMLKVHLRDGTEQTIKASEALPADNTWMHYTGVIDEQGLVSLLYQNGLLAASAKVTQEHKIQAEDSQESDLFGYSVAISGETAIVGALEEDTKGSNAGSAYIFQRQANGNWQQVQPLFGKDAQSYDYFGYSVAISGETAIVGAYNENTKGSDAGSAYIFQRQANGNWEQVEQIFGKDTQAWDYFGSSVAISSETAIVGAPNEDTKGSNAGSAYIFQRQANGDWQQVQQIFGKDTQKGDYFGYSVAISGETAIIGASHEDTKGFNAGSAYIFQRQASGDWEQVQQLFGKDTQKEDYFGYSVAISGETAIVGAYREGTKGSNAGSAYIFQRQANGNWAQVQQLFGKETQAYNYFGSSVAISGKTAIVGAPDEGTKGSDAGSAYIFQRQANGDWQQVEQIFSKDIQTYDHFGKSVAISGETAIVGAPNEDTKGLNAGSAYIFPLGLGYPAIKAIALNSSTDYVDCGDNVVVGSEFTQEAWIYPEISDAGYHGFLGNHPGSGNNRAPSIWVYQQQKIVAGFGDGTTGEAITTGEVLVPNDWNHVAVTFDGTFYKVYVNGEEKYTTEELKGKQPVNTPIKYIGKVDNHFPGKIAEVRVWNIARSQKEIQENMNRRLLGTEQKLAAYWVFNGEQVRDLSPAQNHGTLHGTIESADAPPSLKLETWQPRFYIGGGLGTNRDFNGQIADVQIWNRTRPAGEIKDSMYLKLTGKEQDLAAYYRLGTIVTGESKTVPDFSVHGRDAVVYGEAYVSARTLNRSTGGGLDAIKYSNDELFAVTQRATYEESFEFKVQSAVDINNADGNGNKIFAFSYWGRYSRNSEEKIAFPTHSYQPNDFELLSNGWYRASCQFTVPDGVSVIRTFEINNIKGSWTSIDIRKHQIQLISDAISCDRYTDEASLTTLADPQAGISTEELQQAEQEISRCQKLVWDLEERLDIAQNRQKYVDEKNALQIRIPELKTSKSSAETALSTEINNPLNYFCKIKGKGSGKFLTGWLLLATIWSFDSQLEPALGYLWEFIDNSDGSYRIKDKKSGKMLNVFGNGTADETPLYIWSENEITPQHWCLDKRGSSYVIRKKDTTKVFDVYGGSSEDGAFVQIYESHGGANQLWSLEKTSTRTSAGDSRIKEAEKEYKSLDQQINNKQTRLDRLTEFLNANESVSSLTTQLSTARSNLITAETDFNTKNDTFLNQVTQNQQTPQRMSLLNTDAKELSTRGALLGFARPAGSLNAVESCEGNVLLSYFDNQGRMRLTRYDATADSRNSTFEQWLPDSLRTCLEFRDANDKLTIQDGDNQDAHLDLQPDRWTLEAWFHYPGATKISSSERGSKYDYNVLASAKDGNDYAIVLKDGSRLGTLVDGFFFDCNYDLENKVADGWHHVAAVAKEGRTVFYIDGKPVGFTTTRYALTFDGDRDYVSFSNFKNFPSTAITVACWIRINSTKSGPTPVSYAVSNEDNAFTLYNVKDLRLIINGTTKDTNISFNGGQWHHLAVTWDNSDGTLRVYKDGVEEFVATGFKSGATISGNGTLIIAQEQDSLGGGFKSSEAFDGGMSGLSIWNQALSADEIRDNMYKILEGNESGLVSYWSMRVISQADGTKLLEDQVRGDSNKNNGEIIGDPEILVYTPQCQSNLAVIGNAPNGNRPFGKLAEVRLWNLALTDEEVEINSKTLLTGNEPGLVAYYPMTEATGNQAKDYSAEDQHHGSIAGADWVACTAAIGNPGHLVMEFDGVDDYIEVPAHSNPTSAITVSFWAKSNTENWSQSGFLASKRDAYVMHPMANSKSIRFYIYSNGWKYTGYTSSEINQWHHYAGTFDGTTLKLYVDGMEVANNQLSTTTAVTINKDQGALYLGWDDAEPSRYLNGQIAEVRIWDKARTQQEIVRDMHRHLSGNEENLVGYWPLDSIENGKVKDLSANKYDGTVYGAKLVESAPGSRLLSCEYSSVGLDPNDPKRTLAMMRRALIYTTLDGSVHGLSEKRLEELDLRWIGNAQFQPTLLGYIEGAPPVPSENLTVYYDYEDAASVQLRQSQDVSYSWTRSKDVSQGFDLDLFLGVGWGAEGGFGIVSKISEGRAGFKGSLNLRDTTSNSSTVRADSSSNLTDMLQLRGLAETKPQFANLGARFIPKNVGYALVVSGIADVFITKLKRSGKMISYEIRPAEGIPLDVNTITFMINPAYTMNGTLDGTVGSQAADQRFYRHVPEMRSQYGSLYPASYMRLQQAYDLKQQIEQWDKEREAYFTNYDATQTSESALESQTVDASQYDSYGQVSVKPGGETENGDGSSEQQEAEQVEGYVQSLEGRKEAQKDQAQKRQEEINKRIPNPEKQVQANAAFDAWQRRMENLLIRAGKRNIVNTYVWDADGGLRSEEESFASTIEHTVGGSFTLGGQLGAQVDAMVVGFAFELTPLYTGEMTQTMSKTLTSSKGFELFVNLYGLENKDITDLNDYPVKPGEKVDRYRFMSFYLEGNVNHFHDFFNYVVDPEWLQSNDEEARALRQVQAGKPNKTWRVLHRVTYVERPALMGFGRDLRPVETSDQMADTVLNYFDSLERKDNNIQGQLREIFALLTSLDMRITNNNSSNS